ncbi:MAG: hypothetical protein K2X02_00035 [Alphaproteobacteria bacterium]|nr:hypothetical protein [Alphaproteobacteria bacterium]
MKLKMRFYLIITLLLVLSLNTAALKSLNLDGTRVVSDEDIEWLRGEGYVSVSKFIRLTRALDPEDLEEFDSLNLKGTLLHTSGLRKVTDELLPYLPNLKFLNLCISELREDEDLILLALILKKFNSLEYVNIVGNGIAWRVLSFVKDREENKELTDKFYQKVIFSFHASLEDKFPIAERKKYRVWYQTHKNYYESFPY